MIVRLDASTGAVTVDGLRLADPSFRQFCDWVDAYIALPAAAGADGFAHDLDELACGAAELNEAILTALGAPDGLDPLQLASRTLTGRLLGHWRTHPLDAWAPAGDRPAKGRPLRSMLSGGMAMRAVMYRALPRMAPAAIDALELPQLAMVLGIDDPDRDLDPDEDTGPMLRGGRTTTRSDGKLSRYRFTRRPDQPYLHEPPPGSSAGRVRDVPGRGRARRKVRP